VEKSRFTLAGYTVDLRRSVISDNEKSVAVEPKVLRVLLLLAQRQNEVVTHSEIMDTVWRDMEVVPNALQRCIAILRKCLGDDAKRQAIIATHTKIGYRLVVPVHWLSQTETEPQTADAEISGNRRFAFAGYSIVVLLLLMGVTWFSSDNHNEEQTAYHQSQPLTYTDAHESQAIFSRDGNYAVFTRYAGGCQVHILARHIATGVETQLTQASGVYQDIDFTDDGRELVFAQQAQCQQLQSKIMLAGVTSDKMSCWGLATLDFAQALQAPQVPLSRYNCVAEQLSSPKSVANHHYVFLQQIENTSSLQRYDDLSQSAQLFFQSAEREIYHFDYDARAQRFAVFSRDSQLNHYLTLLDNQGQEKQTAVIRLKAGMVGFQKLKGNFEPKGRYMLLVYEGQLYQLDFNGELTQVATPESRLLSVDRHPTQPQIVAVAGHKDIDIARLTLQQTGVFGQGVASVDSAGQGDLNSVTTPYPSMLRTAAQERLPLFQPGGEAIAFISDRSGLEQIWLWQDGKLVQLTDNSLKDDIHSYAWAKDGQRLAWAAGGVVQITDIKGQTLAHPLGTAVKAVLAAAPSDSWLVTLHDGKYNSLYLLEMPTQKLTPYHISNIEQAFVHSSGIVVRNLTGEVIALPLNPAESEERQRLMTASKSLFVYQDKIISVDAQLSLNQYDLNGDFIRPVKALKPNAWQVTDLQQGQLLLSQFIAINTELVLMH